MVIHDFGFRRYEGKRTPALSRVLAIAASDVRQAFKTRKFLIFYLFCIAPAIMACVIVYIRFIVAEGHGELPGVDVRSRGLARAFNLVDTVDFFIDFGKRVTQLLTIIFSAVIGSGIIARDRRAGALEIYFTRGIGPRHYVAGKFLGVFFLLLCQVLFPFLAVWLFGISVASAESGYIERTVSFIPWVILAQTFACASLAFLLTALSSSTESTRFALLRWAGGLLLLMVAGRILARWFGDGNWRALSPWDVVRRITFEIAQSPQAGLELSTALVAWAVMVAAAFVWLHRHLRPVEVVG